MPHLLFRGLEAEKLQQISRPLVDVLAKVCSCGRDNFTLECMNTTGVWEGEQVPSFPFVEVSWFERGDEVRDRFAEAVDRLVKTLGVPEFEIAFRTYEEKAYYIDGVRFDRYKG